MVDFLLHGCTAGDRPVIADRRIGVAVEASTRAALLAEGPARPRYVQRLAGGVHVAAEPLVGVGRAREVRVGGLVAEPRAGLLGDVEEPLVRPVHGAALAGPDAAAIEEVLHGEVDVHLS